MPPKKITNQKVRALPARPRRDGDSEVTQRWFDQLPPTIRKATKKVGQYEVCIEHSGVVKCSQMKVDTYGWITLVDVAPVSERPHVNMEIRVERIIYVVEVPTLKPVFS